MKIFARLLAAMAGAVFAANTNQTNNSLTLAIPAFYCTIPGLEMNRTLITNYPTHYDPTQIDINELSAHIFFNDVAMSLAVEMVNNDSRILPNTIVKMKRFSDCKLVPGRSYAGDSGGYASTELAQDVLDTHKDVVGMIGFEFSKVLSSVGEIMSINKVSEHWKTKV
ncbi:UNVERIFIED_CONTAM: hypothetical protein HDU68_010975 [Siphonaria sp. JEL0065]|nr:hypothetical protein HDU68_010975 [Siphonaria sp. JEL0065]